MAKIKVKKQTKPQESTKKVIKIKKPTFNFKFSRDSFKNLFSKKTTKIFLMVLVGIVAFILIDLFFQYLNNGYSVAVVDGTRVSMKEYHARLEKQYGQTTAQQLIDETLISLEAKKEGVEVTDEEIQARLDEIITSIGGQEAYESALVANNITEEELRDQIDLDILARKILEPSLEYTDDDVKAFFEQYSSVIFPTETSALEEGAKLDYELYKDQTEEIYIQQEVENEKYTWLEGLYSDYNIQDNSVTKPKYGILSATINIISNLLGDANSNDTETVEE